MLVFLPQLTKYGTGTGTGYLPVPSSRIRTGHEEMTETMTTGVSVQFIDFSIVASPTDPHSRIRNEGQE